MKEVTFFEKFPDYDESNALLEKLLDRVSASTDEASLKKIIHDSGLLWAWIPKWLGGLGLHPLSIYSFAFRLSQYSLGLTNIIGAHYAAIGILSSGRAYSKIRKLVQEMKECSPDSPGLVSLAITEPNAGSDFESAEHLKLAHVMTRAVRTAGGIEVNGQKIYVSNGPWAKWVVFSAYADIKNPLESGVLAVIELSRKGITLGKKEQKLGQNVCTNCMVFFDHVFCSTDEIFADGNPHFSKFLIQESLAPGRVSIAVMSLGVMKSLEQFGIPVLIGSDIKKLETFFHELPSTHLSYRDLPVLNKVLNGLVHLPGIGKSLAASIDSALAKELVGLGKVDSYKKVEKPFKNASFLKASETQRLQRHFEKLLSTSSFSLIADPFFQAQLKDARLLEIIEGTTEVCLKDAEVPSHIDHGTLSENSFGFLHPDTETAALNWIMRESHTIHDGNEWVKSFFDVNDLSQEASLLYSIAYEYPEKALHFYLKAIKVKFKGVDGIWVDGKRRLLMSEAVHGLEQKSLQLLSFDSLCWDEFSDSSSVVTADDESLNQFQSYFLPAILLASADRAWQYAYDYAHERYQGGKMIIHHPEIFHLLHHSQESRLGLKRALKTAIETGAHVSRDQITPFFRFARDTAQVLGGMSYMEEHPISRLYLEIITLAHLSLQK